MLRTLIFDWDGTLHNTKSLYGRSFRKGYGWLVEQGYAPERQYSDEEVSIYLGMSAPDMWNHFMPHLPPAVKEQISGRIGAAMVEEVLAGYAILYPGALEVLNTLHVKGYQLVFLSNCKRAYMEAHKKVFQLDRYFHGFFCCQDYGFAPKTEIFRHIAAAFQGDYCVIGDRASDLAVGTEHSFPSIGCSYGFGTAEELSEASYIAQSVTDIPVLVEKLNRIN